MTWIEFAKLDRTTDPHGVAENLYSEVWDSARVVDVLGADEVRVEIQVESGGWKPVGKITMEHCGDIVCEEVLGGNYRMTFDYETGDYFIEEWEEEE